MWAPLGLMLLCILLVVVARVRLLATPLERDEGEYAYIGQLMLKGIAPYGEAANMKLPGTHAAYALIMALFGQSPSGIHFGFLLVNAGAVAVVFFLARKLFGWGAGVAAAASYAVLSVLPSVMGIWAHATHFIILPALGGTLLLLKWADNRKTLFLAASGILFGMAILAKQTGAIFAIFGLLYLMYLQRKGLRGNLVAVARNVILFFGAAMLPLGVTCVVLWRAGVVDRFWLWVFVYARQYVSIVPFSNGVSLFFQAAKPIATDDPGILLLAVAGLWTLWHARERRSSAIFVTVFLVCSFLAVCPGLYFREHYFILLLPAVALAVGAFATTTMWAVPRAIPLWIVVGALGYSVGHQADYLFQMSPQEAARARYGSNPFPEAIEVADYIRTHTASSDRIVVLGSEPEIYFYAGRMSATPYVYIYPLVEKQPLAARMQDEFIRDVETKKPKYLVAVNVSASWAVQKGSPTRLLEWATPYYQQHYEEVGAVDIYSNTTIYKWERDAAGYRVQSPNFLVILRRKDDGS